MESDLQSRSERKVVMVEPLFCYYYYREREREEGEKEMERIVL